MAYTNRKCGEHQLHVQGTEIRRLNAILDKMSTSLIGASINWSLDTFCNRTGSRRLAFLWNLCPERDSPIWSFQRNFRWMLSYFTITSFQITYILCFVVQPSSRCYNCTVKGLKPWYGKPQDSGLGGIAKMSVCRWASASVWIYIKYDCHGDRNFHSDCTSFRLSPLWLWYVYHHTNIPWTTNA
jgi:hypothetical protein